MAGLASCSDDNASKTHLSNDGNMFASLSLYMPQGRSATNDNIEDDPSSNTNSNSGFEIGQDYENHVGSVVVVLASSADGINFTYLTHSVASSQATGFNENTNRVTYNVTFRNEKLIEHLGEQVYVFAYCNPTEELKENAATIFPDGIGTISNADNDEIWAKQRFLMSNRDLTMTSLPTEAQITETYHDAEHPFPLGTVVVERTACRFDFKSTTLKTEGAEENVYPIYEHGTTNVMANIRLDAMHLINIAKNYYYLPRTGVFEGTTSTLVDGKTYLCGPETSTNWIISPNDGDWKLNPTAANTTANFFYPLGVTAGAFEPKSLTYTTISEIMGHDEDDDENWEAEDKLGYHIWRYATENTLPGIDAQNHNVTTGVVFRAFIEAPTGTGYEPLNAAMTAGNTLYGLEGTLYGDMAMIAKYIQENPVCTLRDQWILAGGTCTENEDGTFTLTEPTSRGESLLTLYRSEDGKYPVYYYYWNRHNDNGKVITMGIMEFATVRNNIYKLAVENIKELGHPGDPDDDPDPEDPDDPDESPKTYFEVKLEVLPWVVRVNNVIL